MENIVRRMTLIDERDASGFLRAHYVSVVQLENFRSKMCRIEILRNGVHCIGAGKSNVSSCIFCRFGVFHWLLCVKIRLACSIQLNLFIFFMLWHIIRSHLRLYHYLFAFIHCEMFSREHYLQLHCRMLSSDSTQYLNNNHNTFNC